MLKAWSDERLTWSGEHYAFDDVEVLPKPMQSPPPVWTAATSEGAIDWAASRGFSILMDPHCTHVELGAKHRHYRERLVAAGFSPAGRDIPMARLIAIGETEERARKVARRGAEWMLGTYIGPKHAGDAHEQKTYSGVDPAEVYVNEVIIHGTPESVRDQIEGLRESASLNYLLCAPLSQQSFSLLTEKVLPAFV